MPQENTADYPVRVVQNVYIPLPDGIRLGATLYMPDSSNDGPFPAVIEYDPYRKDDNKVVRNWQTHSYLARKGHIGVRLDVRGTGASTGIAENEYTRQEQEDCLHALAWLADQSWCTGNIGMWGSSYGGITAIQTAMHAPPQLKAILPMHAVVDRYGDDVHYHGGCVPVHESVAWAGRMVALNALPPLPEIVGDAWQRLWLERLEQTPQWPCAWLQHPHRDAYWEHGSVCENWESIVCPVFAVGGWADSYHNFVLRLLEHLTVPRKGLIGPWLHDRPHTARPGPQIDFLREMVRWWDHWLKGIATGIMDEPLLTVWVQESRPPDPYLATIPGYWRAETEWPVARAQQRTWFLGDGARLQPDCPLETAQNQSTEWNGPLTVGTAAPFWCTGFRPSGMPRDQRRDDACSLAFTSAPLQAPVEILGFPTVRLYVAASEPVAHVAVKLCDVAPDGASLLVTRGVLNLTHRTGHSAPTPLTPRTIYPVTIELGSISHVFAVGHCLRLSMSGADWPLVWPAPRPYALTLYHAAEHPTQLTLPVLPPQTTALPTPVFRPPEVSLPPARAEGEPGSFTILQDMETGTTQMETTSASRTTLHERDLVMTESNRKTLSLQEGNPLSCRAVMTRQLGLERSGWNVQVDSTLHMGCTEKMFTVEIDLRARHNDEVVFERHWKEEVPRLLG